MKIEFNPKLENTEFKNSEHQHMSLILFMYYARKFIFSTKELLGDYNQNNFKDPLNEIYLEIPKEVLLQCGYTKNKDSFLRLESCVNKLNNQELFDLMTSTLFMDLPHTKGLEFLKCKPIEQKQTKEGRKTPKI